MTDTCRLCLSMTQVNNSIFGDDNKIYLKIVSCLPVKVTKEDTLPKKICDVCSCKIDDFYQFCHRTLEAENRLLDPSKSDAEINSSYGLGSDILIYKKTEPLKFSSNFSHLNGYHGQNNDVFHPQGEHLYNSIQNKLNQLNNSITEGTQTDEPIKLLRTSDIKKEQGSLSPYGSEPCNENDDSYFYNSERLQPNDLLKINVPNNQDNNFFFEETQKKKTKRVKKPKKLKDIKIKIKKTKSKFSVQTNYLSDSDDEVSLKKLKSKQGKKPPPKLEVLDDIKAGEILDIQDIKREDLDSDSYLENVKVEFDTEKEEWNCCVCFMRYNSRNSMLAHYRTHYTNPASFHASLLKVQSLEEGVESKTSTCPVCQKIYTSKATFTKHLQKHGNDKPYKCSLCEKTFKNPLEILKHGKKSHTYEDELDYGDDEKKLDQRGPRPTTKRFICDMCDETFVYMKYLMVHRNATHKEAEGRHLINRCLHCRREFTHLNSLRRHLRSHSGERNFLCYVCGKALTSREHLKFHIRIHTGFKPNICKTCGKGFVKKCNLTLHERVHSGEKPHVCSHCGKAFSQRSTLVIHERYHSGLRPYTCTLCNKGFVAKGLLSVHMKTSCI